MIASLSLDFPLSEVRLFQGVGEFVDGTEMQAFGCLVVADAGGDAFPKGDVLMV